MKPTILFFVLNTMTFVIGDRLGVLYQWKYLDWVWPNVALTGKNFTHGNPFTQDIDVDSSSRVFVTTPQWLEGTPITLSIVTKLQGPGGPLLTPYPHWTWHTSKHCDKLISVYRIMIDECNRLWLVDVGRIANKTVCPMKIMIFDLSTDRLIHKYEIPNTQTFGQTSLVTPIVEIGKTCLNAYLYVADVSEYGLLIYDLEKNRSWKLNNTRGNAFGPDSDATNITINNESFELNDGTLGMSLSPSGFFEQRYLYFNSLASYYQKFVSVEALKRSEIEEPIFYKSIYKRQSQAGVQATSKKGIIFFQLVQLTAIACWNIQTPFIIDNIEILAFDVEALQYVSGIKIITNHEGDEELWLNTNRLQKIINNTKNPAEVNFRIIKGSVDQIINGTKCAPDQMRSQYQEKSSWCSI